LITGHSGFKGGWLAKTLLNCEAEIIGLSLKPASSPNLFESLGLNDAVKNYFFDIREFEKVKDVVEKEKPEIVFHLAAQPLVRASYDDPLCTFETNIIGTANVLQAVKEVGCVRSVVIITTDKVYEDDPSREYEEEDKLGGHDPYSSSKAAAEIITSCYIRSFFGREEYLKSHKTLVASARAGNVIGGGDWSKDRIIPDIIRSVFEKKEEIVLRNPGFIRPWQFLLDPLFGYMLLAKKLYEGDEDISGAWNFGPNESSYLTVEELAGKAIKILGRDSYSVQKDDGRREAKTLKLNSRKARELLGWHSVLDIDAVLNFTFEWYKDFYGGKDMAGITNEQIKYFLEKYEL
jgi:CDP-glucose 4,6-dehydratase